MRHTGVRSTGVPAGPRWTSRDVEVWMNKLQRDTIREHVRGASPSVLRSAIAEVVDMEAVAQASASDSNTDYDSGFADGTDTALASLWGVLGRGRELGEDGKPVGKVSAREGAVASLVRGD